MSDVETRLRALMQDTASTTTTPAVTVAGARRYAARARRLRLAGAAAAIAVALGVGGAIASGALRDRTLTPARPHPTTSTARTLPRGPAWIQTVTVTNSKGATFLFDVRAVITRPAGSAPDPQDRGKRLVTVAQMGGYYTLTNTSAHPYDLNEPVRLFAYWKVPSGFCRRWNPYFVADLDANQIPVVQVAGRQELCPMAWGDSTLDTIPQTLSPHAPAPITILATTMGVLGQDYPLHLSTADAAIVAHVTATPPVGWFASDEELSTSRDHRIASKGLPAP